MICKETQGEKNTESEPAKRGHARSLHLQVQVVVVREEAATRRMTSGGWPAIENEKEKITGNLDLGNHSNCLWLILC